MSAWLMPTCGRPGAVSSILTEIVGVVGTAPMPVYGFLGAGLGGGGGVDDEEGAVVVGAGELGGADFFGLLSPLHAAVASSAITASAATERRSGRAELMGVPLPLGPVRLGRGGRPMRAAGRPRAGCRRCRRTAASPVARPSGTGAASAACAGHACR